LSQKWRFKRITIDNAWVQGDPEILNALQVARLCARNRSSLNNSGHIRAAKQDAAAHRRRPVAVSICSQPSTLFSGPAAAR
jgi:hypothetical protein